MPGPTKITIFHVQPDSRELSADVRLGASFLCGTPTQGWRWRGGEAVVVCFAAVYGGQTAVVVRRGSTAPKAWLAEGVGPLLRALLGREVRTGVRRGPRPVAEGRVAMRAILARACRRAGRRFRVVRVSARMARWA